MKVRITENDIRKIVNEAVSRILNESGDTKNGQKGIGGVYGRALKKAALSTDMNQFRKHDKVMSDAEEASRKGMKGKSDKESSELMKSYLDGIEYGRKKPLKEEELEDDDDWFWKQQEEDELNYEMGEFERAMQKSNGTYKKTVNGFSVGDRVLVHARKGDFEGTIEDFDTHMMTWEDVMDVKRDSDGFTVMGVPFNKVEKI